MFVGAPGWTPVAVKLMTGADVPCAVTDSVLVPVEAPSVQLGNVASPAASVNCVAPVMLPPPAVTWNSTEMDERGLPKASTVLTAGLVGTGLPVAPVWLLPAMIVTVATGPAAAVAV